MATPSGRYTTVIDPQSLAQRLDDDDWVILDARFSLADTEQGRRAHGISRIPGAQYAHLDDALSGPIISGSSGRHPLPNRTGLADQFGRWGVRQGRQMVVYDDKVGAVAARLWWLSKWLGHDACAVLDGGFDHWQSLGLPIDSTPLPSTATRSRDDALDAPRTATDTSAATSSVTAGTDDPGFVATDPLLSVIDIEQAASGQWQLIDARETERYLGKHEPIDPVAGHIPGALSRPFIDNVDDHGRFRPATELRKRFEDLAVAADGKPLAHYCGSGVTAAHNLLAMVHAGLEPGALYAGSFSEWITREAADYPVATENR